MTIPAYRMYSIQKLQQMLRKVKKTLMGGGKTREPAP